MTEKEPTTIRLMHEMKEKVKIAGEIEEESMNSIIEKAIAVYLKEHGEKEKIDKIYEVKNM